jgi:predicted nucleic acid-binding protein
MMAIPQDLQSRTTLVTANVAEFDRVRRLVCQDWTAGEP